MIDQVFADSCYWTALINRLDNLHQKALQASQLLHSSPTIIVTSQMNLIEVLDYFAEKGQFLRKEAVKFVKALQENPNCKVIPQTAILFNEALKLYIEREDKSWSLTDCASIKIIHNEGIQKVLTYDHHFEQAGFIVLLRD